MMYDVRLMTSEYIYIIRLTSHVIHQSNYVAKGNMLTKWQVRKE